MRCRHVPDTGATSTHTFLADIPPDAPASRGRLAQPVGALWNSARESHSARRDISPAITRTASLGHRRNGGRRGRWVGWAIWRHRIVGRYPWRPKSPRSARRSPYHACGRSRHQYQPSRDSFNSSKSSMISQPTPSTARNFAALLPLICAPILWGKPNRRDFSARPAAARNFQVRRTDRPARRPRGASMFAALAGKAGANFALPGPAPPPALSRSAENGSQYDCRR
jgi:hypothetical protein